MKHLLDTAGLGRRLGYFRERLFRMETLPAYAVDTDGGDYQRWLAGEPEPTWERKARWMDVLRQERAAGKVSSRVRILSEQLTDYERYACAWGYALNTEAGEDIRVLHRGEHRIPDGLIDRDFWVVDDDEVVEMYYDEHGRFEGAEVLPQAELTAHLESRNASWVAAEPFAVWWGRHPELHCRAAA